LLFKAFKLLVRAALFIFCKKIEVINRSLFAEKGPILIVANHPNSFLDAILIGSIFSENVHFLARGDAFKQKKYRFLLKMLKMIPIYRLSEGKENLHLNEHAFTESTRILQSGGIVLIFIEGICINSHLLQPFKKGAARIALHADTPKPLRVVPIAITYDSFFIFGKTVRIEAAQPIFSSTLFPFKEEAKNLIHFNKQLRPIVEAMIQVPISKKAKGYLPQTILALIGKWIHYPFYWYLSKAIRKKTRCTVFYDSVLFGSLFLIYPLYLITLHAFFYLITGSFLIIVSSIMLHLIGAIVASKWLSQ
jgi:1-acyl-sn-glycerol-3-phosphate acyltransferase